MDESGLVPSGRLRSHEQQSTRKARHDANERKRMQSLLDDEWEAHFYGGGTETHLVVTGLVVKFTHNGCGQGRRLIARPELRLENHFPGQNGECVRSNLDLLRFRIRDRFGRDRTGRPGQLEWDQKL